MSLSTGTITQGHIAQGQAQKKKLRSIFMGTPELAVPALQKLAVLTDCQRVITQPDRRAGRGKKMRAPAVKIAAEELGLSVWQPETLRGAEHAHELQDVDIFVVMAYGEILRQAVLDIPVHGCINLHCSLLPRWRGASPLQAAIRAGDAESGVAVMEMVRALDAGPVYLQKTLALAPRCTLASVHDPMAACAADALEAFFDQRESLTCVQQDLSAVTLCGKLLSVDGHLDFTGSMTELDAWIRAYTPAPGCWVLADGQRMRIHEARPAPEYQNHTSGDIFVDQKRMFIACADGALEILRLQPAGKRAMQTSDFLNGHPFPQVIA